MTYGSITIASVAAALLWLGGCGKSGPPRAQALGEAFVGPATLKIRSDIPLQSSAVATVKHGDRLEILQTRRRFLRVRTPNGAEGWTDERQLLAASDMAALKELTAHAARLPSQGVATTYAALNIHTQPVVSSPSFLQLKENEKFDVLQSIVLERSEVPRKSLIAPPPKKAKAPPKKEKKTPKVPPPPMPKPPSPPSDWLELSKTERDEAAAEQLPPQKLAPKVDGWSLIRTPPGQAGWVLTRLVSMAIPDEVAQYAEGKRIVSYFPLGEIVDNGQKKHTWPWTTTSDSKQPYDFDSFRVFTWSLKRHRYETGYIERSVIGYSPVLVKDVDLSSKSGVAKYPGFSVCVEKKDGQRVRREYAAIGVAIRFAGEHPCEPAPPPPTLQNPSPLPVTEIRTPDPKPGWGERLKQRWHAITGK